MGRPCEFGSTPLERQGKMCIRDRYTGSLSHRIEQEYHIGEELYRGDIKRGLRNSDGTGVPIGVTRVGSVLGYMIEDGVRIPVPGQLYYRGIELNEIVEAHRQAGTFGFEEVAYLLLMGYLPSRGELDRFNEIMNRARKLPNGFTEDMIKMCIRDRHSPAFPSWSAPFTGSRRTAPHGSAPERTPPGPGAGAPAPPGPGRRHPGDS